MRLLTRVMTGVCLCMLTFAGTARGSEHRRLTLVLDFSTCVVDSGNADVIVCEVATPAGERAGSIKVTFQSMIATDATSMSWHESWEYRLDSGTLKVSSSTDWQAAGLVPDENGFSPVVGFGRGEVTSGKGRFGRAEGTITMRWDDNICICLIDLTRE